MATLFFKRIRYYSLTALTIAGVIFLACFFFTHLILRKGGTDGATSFIYWVAVISILAVVGICFYHERPRENKTIEAFGNKLESLFGLAWGGAFFSLIPFAIVGFVLLLIFGKTEVHAWPTWARALEGSIFSIMGVSAFLGLIVSFIQVFVEKGDD